MKKLLQLAITFGLFTGICLGQSIIDQVSVLQFGYQTSPGTPPAFSGYVYINSSGQFTCVLNSGAACSSNLSGGSGLPTGCTGAAGVITCTGFVTNNLNGGITGTEGTGASLTAGAAIDLLYPDSSNHCWHQSLNNADVGCTDVAGLPILATSASVSAPAYSFASNTNSGIYSQSSASIDFAAAGVQLAQLFNNGVTASRGLYVLRIGLDIANGDVFVNRQGAGILGIGKTGTTADAAIEAAAYISTGTKFTTNNGCTDGSNVGGATAGYFAVGSTSCTEVVTMGSSSTAPNGWSCTVVDITTLADVTNPHQTTSNATTATFVTGTVVSGDHIQFSCIGY